MSVLDKTYGDKQSIASVSRKIWCDNDRHSLFEFFTDFNEWLDGEDGLEFRVRYMIEGFNSPSKALFASDSEMYNQAFKEFRTTRISQVLCEDILTEVCGHRLWFENNKSRFEQLVERLMEDTVVPFVGAGLSVECGFPTWKEHLLQQGLTSGMDAAKVNDLLQQGRYEEVIQEIEGKGYKEAFIQQVRDIFIKTGKVTDTTLRLTELFTDTIITTNYDHIIQQAFDTGKKDNVQLIDSANILEEPIEGKVTIIKLHGDVKRPARCILSKRQYDDAYGDNAIDLSRPIPKLLSYYYRTSSLLFLGCSLNHDRTMQVFEAVKKEMDQNDLDRPLHFSLEAMPENKEKLTERNAYLLSYGITPIWFPAGSYDYIEQILRCAKNETNYNGYQLTKSTHLSHSAA